MIVVAVLALAESAWAQSSRIDGGAVSQPEFGFYWETRLEPTPPFTDSITTATADEPGVIHRVLLDRAQRVYVGYDALVVRLPEPNTYRVTFRRLEMTPAIQARLFLGDGLSSWRQVATPGWNLQTPQTIRGGEVLELSLLVNPSTRQRVMDYVTVQEPSRRFQGFDQIPERRFSYAGGPARDFRVTDVELTIQSPRLSINGKLDESSTRVYEEVSGSVVWFATGKRGRYILSLLPRSELGFRKAGEVRGSSLRFTVGSDTFTLNTGGRIAPGQASFSLYVLHDPEWRPTYPNADLSAFFMGAADSADSLVRK